YSFPTRRSSDLAVFYGDVPGRDVRDHLGDEEGVEPGGAVPLGKTDHFVLEGFQSPDAGPPDNADPEFVDIAQIDAGIGNGLVRTDQGVLGEAVQLPGFLAIKKILGVIALEFTGKFCLELFGIKIRDGGRSALPFP